VRRTCCIKEKKHLRPGSASEVGAPKAVRAPQEHSFRRAVGKKVSHGIGGDECAQKGKESRMRWLRKKGGDRSGRAVIPQAEKRRLDAGGDGSGEEKAEVRPQCAERKFQKEATQ